MKDTKAKRKVTHFRRQMRYYTEMFYRLKNDDKRYFSKAEFYIKRINLAIQGLKKYL